MIQFVSLSAGVVDPGGQIELDVHAEDLDGDAITFTWSSTEGSFGTQTDTATSSQALYIAPGVTGPQTITLEVEDERLAKNAMDVVVQVQSTATGGASVTVEFQNLPIIEGVSATPAPLTPSSPVTRRTSPRA